MPGPDSTGGSAAPDAPGPAPTPPARPTRSPARRAAGRGLLWAAGLTALVLAYIHLARPAFTVAGIYLRIPEDTLSVLKGALALLALGLAGWEAARRLRRCPLPRRGVAVVAGALAVLATAGYLNSDDLAYGRYYHLWEFFHYYLGSKYHAELGYKRLYACAAVAEAELGAGFAAEVRRRQIRDLETDTVVPAATALADPTACTRHFTPRRWAQFRADLGWLRGQASFSHWSLMQVDHGYNPPPLWTMIGGTVANLVRAGPTGMKALASLDVVLLGLLFFFVWWSFGWRALCLSLVFFGCQFPANGLFTAGGFLRQDWLLATVAAVCLAHRRRFAWAGAALAAAALLRLFPALLFAGPVVLALAQLVRRRGLARAHLRFFGGAAAAGVALVALTLVVVGPAAYPRFVAHIRLHSSVPLTNNMGLRVLVARLTWHEPPRVGPVRVPSLKLEPLPAAAQAHPTADEGAPVSAPVPDSAPAPAADDPPPTTATAPAEATVAAPQSAPAPTLTPGLRRIAPAGRGLRLQRMPVLTRPAAPSAPPSRFTSAAGRALFVALAAMLAAAFVAVAWRQRRLWAAAALGLVLVVGLLEITCYYYSLFIVAALLTRRRRWLERVILGATAASALLVVWPRLATAWPDRYAAQSAVFVTLAVLLLVASWRRRRRA